MRMLYTIPCGQEKLLEKKPVFKCTFCALNRNSYIFLFQFCISVLHLCLKHDRDIKFGMLNVSNLLFIYSFSHYSKFRQSVEIFVTEIVTETETVLSTESHNINCII